MKSGLELEAYFKNEEIGKENTIATENAAPEVDASRNKRQRIQ